MKREFLKRVSALFPLKSTRSRKAEGVKRQLYGFAHSQPAWLATESLEDRTLLAAAFPEFIDPHPASGNQFGAQVVPLTTGNVVITSPYDDAGGTDAGAVYLFNGATGALISTLTGSTANDTVGIGGVTALTNGNFVVNSHNWANGTATFAGAVTWASGLTGLNGVVSAANSLVGSTSGDQVGVRGVLALNNGNYVVSSSSWNNGAIVDAGAVTWGNGTTGIKGPISAGNSLVGSKSQDQVGNYGSTALTNGNYVVSSRSWDNVSVVDAGAVTWGSGTTGIVGPISAFNSLVGLTTNDSLSSGGITPLTNGNYVVSSHNWNNVAAANAGAVTWGSGTTGISGTVNATNSLVGTKPNDFVGYDQVTALTNGNYVVSSYKWDNGSIVDVGAVTWGNGTTGVKGVVGAINSLVGSIANDMVGIGRVTALTNGNYVVNSRLWNNGPTVDAGAVTWGNGTTGITGVVSSGNSLVGTIINDQVGSQGVTALTNGNYVVASPLWENVAATDGGAVTWGNGNTGIIGAVSSGNSLVGTTFGDQVGGGGITALSNGHYVVQSPLWDNSSATDAGAVTWRNGTIGTGTTVTTANSLVGTIAGNNVGLGGVTALTNGNYVVLSPNWDNGTPTDVGAVTWRNGSATNAGPVSNLNSLLGSTANDKLGIVGSVLALVNGNYVVRSPNWDNGPLTDAGAMTFGSGITGLVDSVSMSNSARGNSLAATLQTVVLDNANQHFYGSFVNEDSGRVRVGSQIDGFPKIAASINSGNLTIDGRDGDNNITVRAVGSNLVVTDPGELFDPGSTVGVLSANGHTLTIPLSSLTGSITVNGGRGNDTLTLDLTAGDPIPAGGFVFNGNDPVISPGDTLKIVGGNQGTVTYNYTNPNDGSVVMSNYGTVSYTGLEPILNTGSATNIIFNLPAELNNATLSDDGISGNNLSRLLGATFESTTFATPTESLQLRRGTVNDGLSINALPDFAARLNVGTSTAPFQSVDFNGVVDLAAGKSLTVHAETISTFAELKTSGAAVSLNAADGITLNASIETGGGDLLLNSDTDSDGNGTLLVAAPVSANWALPPAESTLKRAAGSADDIFGGAVAISKDGNTAIVGASADDIGSRIDQGSAAVFIRSGGVWIQQATLISLTGAAGDRFGVAVSLSADGNTAAIGAYQDDVGNDTDEGSVTIFTRTAGVWAPQAQLSTSDGSVSDGFGIAVDLSNDGNSLVVGAYLDDATNTDQGSVTVFSRSGSSWTQTAKLTASDNAASDRLGYSVAMSGDGNTIIGGAYLNDIGTAADRGSAYVFTKSGSTWAQTQLLASDGGPGDRFGTAVDLSDNGNTALVGSYRDDIGSNTDQGSALVYTRSGTTWTQLTQKLTASDGAASDNFGYTVSLSGDGNTALVGLRLDDAGSNVDQGSAAIFARSGSTWTQRNRLFGADGTAGDEFGVVAAINGDGTTLIVGAYKDDVGSNANQGSATILSQTGGTPGGSLSSAMGSIDMIVADADLQGNVSSTTSVNFITAQIGRAIDLGTTTANNLSLTDAELDRISATSLGIGNSAAGPVTVNAPITRNAATGLAINSGNHIFLFNGSLDAGGGSITLTVGAEFAVHPMLSGVDVTTAATQFLSFGVGSNLAIVINGAAVDTQLRQLNVVGKIDVTGADLVISGPYTPLDTDSFTIVVNDGTDPIIGTFNALPEGATVNVNGRNKRITYVGGTGNDVVLLDIISPTISGTTPTLTGSTLPAGTTSLQVTFSESIVGGATAANFGLRRAGADGRLGNADDIIVTISSATYANATFSTTLTFPALVEDVYRLTVQEAISDVVGNGLDGDGNDISGGSVRTDFIVQTIPDALPDPGFGDSGAVDTEFNYLSSRSDSASDVAVQTDGKLVIAGAGRVLRYNVNGSIDTTFGTSGSVAFPGTARSLALQSDGKIVVVGYVYEYNYATLQSQWMFSAGQSHVQVA